jgi:hypothetical protein
MGRTPDGIWVRLNEIRAALASPISVSDEDIAVILLEEQEDLADILAELRVIRGLLEA